MPTLSSDPWAPGGSGSDPDPTGPGSDLLAAGSRIPEGAYAYFRLNIDPSDTNSSITLSLGNGTDSATSDDYSSTIQVWVGGAWVNYSNKVDLTSADPQYLYVRVLTLENAPDGEPDEVFTLNAELHDANNALVGETHPTATIYDELAPPPPPPPPPEETGENWFIAQQGNKNLDQAYTMEEEEQIFFNVQFQDRSGSQIGVVHDGDVVGVKIQLSGSALNMLDVLDISPSNEFNATWHVNGDILEVQLTNKAGHDVNLQGNPFDVVFKVTDDHQTGTNTNLGFDILSATVGHVWESNDQANYIIKDAIAKGNNPVV